MNARRTLARAEARLGWLWLALILLGAAVDGAGRMIRTARVQHAAEIVSLREQLEAALVQLDAANTPDPDRES